MNALKKGQLRDEFKLTSITPAAMNSKVQRIQISPLLL
jgi:hypothetical protein